MTINGTKVGLGAVGATILAGFAWSGPEARASAEWALAFFLKIIDDGPIGLWAVLLAVLTGWLVMLRFSMLPIRCMTPVAMSLTGQMFGGAAAFAVVWLLWRDPLGLIVGALIALSTPVTWALALVALELLPGEWTRRWAAELRGEGRQLQIFTKRPQGGD